MKKIYLHIGCGKTGSSALQLWLNHNTESLQKAGIFYPLFGQKKLEDYAITSGNGGLAVQAIQRKSAKDFFTHLISQSGKNDILLSSETFQLLTGEELKELSEILRLLELEPVVIAYVRDLYDIVHSSYLQLVKRDLYTKTFDEYVLSLKKIQQFEVLQDWEQFFEEIHVIHYDSVQNKLDQSFLEVLGIDSFSKKGIMNLFKGVAFPPMKNIRINRSLTLVEAEQLRYLNELLQKRGGKLHESVKLFLSDALIEKRPEESTSIYFNEKLLSFLRKNFLPQIERINARYFDAQPRLVLFDNRNKNIENHLPQLDKSFYILLEVLLESIVRFDFETDDYQLPLKPYDSRIPDALLRMAVIKENDSLGESMLLARAAKVLRPTGPKIIAKLDEYQLRLNSMDKIKSSNHTRSNE